LEKDSVLILEAPRMKTRQDVQLKKS